jgi:KDO2-lipid IV(A) lauroyltransferase
MLMATLRRLSPGARRVLAFGFGNLAFALGIRRRIALDNVRLAFPEYPPREHRRIARASYGHMFLSALEGLCGHTLSESTSMELVRWHLLEERYRKGTGALVASAHFGSWELMAELVAARGIGVAAVVRPLSGALNARLFEARREAGMELIHPRGALRGMLKALKAGKLVVQLVDQSLSADRAVFVPFFGRMTATAPALSMAAVSSGVPAYLVLSERIPGGMRVLVEGPFVAESTGDNKRDVARHVAEVTAALEAHIRRCPEQWMWMHRRWKVPWVAP